MLKRVSRGVYSDDLWKTAVVHLCWTESETYLLPWKQLSGARNLLQYQSKRYFATSGPRHVIPRRSLAPRLVIAWLTTAIMAISPFIWYQFFANSTTGNGWSDAGRQSIVRKLVLLVFVLSFAMPLISSIASYCLLLRTWLLVRKEW
jgi:hypothetical protein